jgi:hypothetical protein
VPARRTTSKPEPPKGVPVLIRPRLDVRQKLEAQLARTPQLKVQAQTKDALDAARAELQKWRDFVRDYLLSAFSHSGASDEFDRQLHFVWGSSTLGEDILEHNRDVDRLAERVTSVVERLEIYEEAAPMRRGDAAEGTRGQQGPLAEVFVVHGHDDGLRQSMARFLERLGLTAIILNEQANRGRTIIEELERHSNASFAVVLLTPDDEGRRKGTPALNDRARENVVFDLDSSWASLAAKTSA